MTKIEPLTIEDFKAAGSSGRQPSAEVMAVRELKVGDGLRFVKHEHGPSGSAAECNLRTRIRLAVWKRDGFLIATKHDGDDLLVMRMS